MNLLFRWMLVYGRAFLAAAASFTGGYINVRFRRRLKLRDYGFFPTMLGATATPAITTSLFYSEVLSATLKNWLNYKMTCSNLIRNNINKEWHKCNIFFSVCHEKTIFIRDVLSFMFGIQSCNFANFFWTGSANDDNSICKFRSMCINFFSIFIILIT